MGFSVHWSWLTVLFFLLSMGGEVGCDCTEENMEIEGGFHSLTKGLTNGSTLVYHCPLSYYPYPAFIRKCQYNGKWSPAPKTFQPQRCKLVECPDPRVMENGNVLPQQETYFVHNETTYECHSGYTLRGSSRRVCLPNGKWSGSTPICSRDTRDACADPGIPAGATRTGTIFDIGDTVKYSCKDNLLLVGSSERVCQENGQWTGIEPSCYYKHTYDTSLEVSEVFGSALKNTLMTVEVDDYTHGDTRRIRISRNGTLNIYIALDISESISKEHIQNSKLAIKTLISKVSSFSVNPNFEILFFGCDIFEIVNILDFWDGGGVMPNILNAMDTLHRDDDSTFGSDLKLVFKTFFERMAILKVRVGEEAFKEHRHVMIVFTDGAYNMGAPEPIVAKIKNLVYMGNETQSREEYLDIYMFGIGNEIFDAHLMDLAAGTGGRHYFRMKDIGSLQETFDEMIDETNVLELCGLHKDYDSGTRDSQRMMYPWTALIYIQDQGMRIKCHGSLVSPSFVLTAAQCIPFGTEPNHITVEIDDGRGRVKRVKTFIMHPKFNISAKSAEGVAEFYDYGVALIQLMEPVQISKAVRPICIPCTQETSGALKLVGASTCKDQEQILLRNQHEKLNFLSISGTDKRIIKKDVVAKLGDSRDDCIRHALEAGGVNTNDPRVAVTDNFLCTGGQSPYRDHIACTGDTGGAVYKNYEHRTIQVAMVSWGNKQLCTSGGLIESTASSRDFHLNLFRVVPFLKSVLGKDTDDYAPLQFLEN